MQASKMLRSGAGAVRPFTAARTMRPAGAPFRPAAAQSQHRCHATQQPAAQDGVELLSLPLASALLWAQPLAARADEADAPSTVQAAAEGAQQAAEAASEVPTGPTWLSYVVVLTPIILYGIFNVYRSQVNPRIKFSDFLFIVAGVAVVANLVAIIGFKVRLF